jgi:hypothetical protein
MNYSKVFFAFATASVIVLAGLTLMTIGQAMSGQEFVVVALAIAAAAVVGRVSGTLSDRFARLTGTLVSTPLLRNATSRALKLQLAPAPTRAEPTGRQEIPYEQFDYESVVDGLVASGINVEPLPIDRESFAGYLERAKYSDYHPDYYKGEPHFLKHKQVQHYVSFLLCPPQADQVWMDVASSSSPFPEILTRLAGPTVYRQDLSYPAGVNGLRIGSDGRSIPMADGSIDFISLHCSFEHFEGDADTGFIEEAARLLAPGGAVTIVPLYVSDTAQVLTNPRHWMNRGIPRGDSSQITLSKLYWESHGRFYNFDTLSRRVLAPLDKAGLSWKIFRVIPPAEYEYPPFLALKITQPDKR